MNDKQSEGEPEVRVTHIKYRSNNGRVPLDLVQLASKYGFGGFELKGKPVTKEQEVYTTDFVWPIPWSDPGKKTPEAFAEACKGIDYIVGVEVGPEE